MSACSFLVQEIVIFAFCKDWATPSTPNQVPHGGDQIFCDPISRNFAEVCSSRAGLSGLLGDWPKSYSFYLCEYRLYFLRKWSFYLLCGGCLGSRSSHFHQSDPIYSIYGRHCLSVILVTTAVGS